MIDEHGDDGMLHMPEPLALVSDQSIHVPQVKRPCIAILPIWQHIVHAAVEVESL